MKPKNAYFQYFQASMADFDRALAEVRTKKAKGKPVHQLRVNSRKLRVLLHMGDPEAKFKKLRRKLKCIGRLAGAERELEVAQKDAAAFHFSLPHQKKLRRKARKVLRQEAKRGKYRRLPGQLAEAEKAMRRLGPPAAQAWEGELSALPKWSTHIPAKPAEFHQLRIDLKKARYALEARRKKPRILKKMQQTLGKAHDLEVLGKMAGKKKRVEAARKKLERQAVADLPKALRAAK